MNDSDIRRLAQRHTIYSLPGPSGRRQQAQRAARLRILLFIALVVVALFLFASIRPGEAAPPRPADTQAILPPPPGRHETLLYCRHFLQPGQAANRPQCRRVRGYR